MDLGRRIYARYRFSPGVVQLEPGSGVANDVLGFSDRLPLLHILHQRWSLDRASFPILDNPIWLRLRSQPSSPERHTMVARVAASHPPAALPMGPPASESSSTHPGLWQQQEPGSGDSNAEPVHPQSTSLDPGGCVNNAATESPSATRSPFKASQGSQAGDLPTGSDSTVAGTGTPNAKNLDTTPPYATLFVADATSVGSAPGSRFTRPALLGLSPTPVGGVAPQSRLGRIHRSAEVVSQEDVRKATEGNPAAHNVSASKATTGAESISKSSPQIDVDDGKSASASAQRQTLPPASDQTQMGPPIFLRAGKGTVSTKQPSVVTSEVKSERKQDVSSLNKTSSPGITQRNSPLAAGSSGESLSGNPPVSVMANARSPWPATSVPMVKPQSETASEGATATLSQQVSPAHSPRERVSQLPDNSVRDAGVTPSAEASSSRANVTASAPHDPGITCPRGRTQQAPASSQHLPATPQFVQRKLKGSVSAGSESSGAESPASGATGLDRHAGQADAQCSRREDTNLSGNASATLHVERSSNSDPGSGPSAVGIAGADLVLRHSEASWAHPTDTTMSRNAAQSTPVSHPSVAASAETAPGQKVAEDSGPRNVPQTTDPPPGLPSLVLSHRSLEASPKGSAVAPVQRTPATMQSPPTGSSSQPAIQPAAAGQPSVTPSASALAGDVSAATNSRLSAANRVADHFNRETVVLARQPGDVAPGGTAPVPLVQRKSTSSSPPLGTGSSNSMHVEHSEARSQAPSSSSDARRLSRSLDMPLGSARVPQRAASDITDVAWRRGAESSKTPEPGPALTHSSASSTAVERSSASSDAQRLSRSLDMPLGSAWVPQRAASGITDVVVWRRGAESSKPPEPDPARTHSSARSTAVQRSSANGVQTPLVLPGLGRSNSSYQLGTSPMTHPILRRTVEGATPAEVHPPFGHSPAKAGAVQRAPSNSATPNAVRTPSAPPSVGRSNPTSQVLPPGDLAELTNRVYELLVRRLAAEKQRRGI